jgi:hypothetical protein
VLADFAKLVELFDAHQIAPRVDRYIFQRDAEPANTDSAVSMRSPTAAKSPQTRLSPC